MTPGAAMSIRQRGVALLTAILITALVTVIAVAMASQQQLDIRRTENIMDADRAYVFGLGVESWARQILARDRRNSQTDDLTEDWAVVLPPLSVEGATVMGHIVDMQGRFNLNNLLDKDGKPSQPDIDRFNRLLEAVGLDPNLSLAVLDWIDPDQNVSFPSGAEDTTYMALDPPYRAANQAMVSPSELLLVKGFDLDSYDKLAPFVSALPERTTINVNTAPPEVLMAVVSGLSQAEAKTISEETKDKGFASVAEFQQRVKAYPLVPPDAVSVSTSYFLVWSDTHFGRGELQLYSLLQRQSNASVSVLERSQGIY
jgi:general secretion pathway protein K